MSGFARRCGYCLSDLASAVALLVMAAAVAIMCLFLFTWDLLTWGRRRGKRQQETVDGSHEACPLTDEEDAWFQFFTRRYPNLGNGVKR